MYCDNCGTQIPDDAKFCPHCCAKIPEIPEHAEDSTPEPEQAAASAREPEQAAASVREPEQAAASAREPEQAAASSREPDPAAPPVQHNETAFSGPGPQQSVQHWRYTPNHRQNSYAPENNAGQQAQANAGQPYSAQSGAGRPTAGQQTAGQPNPGQPGNYAYAPGNNPYQQNYYGRNQQTSVPHKPLSKTAKIIICAAVAAVVAVILVFSLHKPTIDLTKYVTIEASGYDTLGTASATFDFDQMYQDNKSTINKALKKQPGVSALNNIVDVDDVMDFLSGAGLLSDLEEPGSLDKSDELSNGDTITFSFDMSDDDIRKLEDDLNCKVKCEDITYTVSGLQEVETFDPFDMISVSFSGVAPEGTAEVSCNDEDLDSLIAISADPSDGLSNGDTVTVSIDYYYDEESFLDSYGKLPSKTSETVTVSGLLSGISGAADISDDAMNQMKQQAEDLFTAQSADAYGEADLTGTEYLGYYVLLNKSQDVDYYSSALNAVDLIYKLSVSLTADDGSQSAYQYYAAVEFDNLMTDGDGNTNVDVTSGYIVDDGFEVEVKPQNDDYWTTSVYLYGYKTLKDMYNAVVSKHMADYTVDDHLDVQVDDTEAALSATSSPDAGNDDLLNNDYIIPDSASRELTDADVEGLTLQELNYAKNEIYARHGRKFQSPELQNYFDSKSWYTGTIEPDDFSNDMLSDVEKKNAEFLSDKEFAMDPAGYQLDAG